MSASLAAFLYLVSGALFIMALRGLSSPESSRQGNLFGMIGMAIAIVTTLAYRPPVGLSAWILVVIGMLFPAMRISKFWKKTGAPARGGGAKRGYSRGAFTSGAMRSS